MGLCIPIGLLGRPTTAAPLRGVARVDRVHQDSQLLGLVGQDLPELGESPVGDPAVLVPSPFPLDLLEVLQHDDPHIITLTQYRLDRTAEEVIPEAVLTAGKRLKSLAARRCALGFQSSTDSSEMGGAIVQPTSGQELPAGGHGDVSDALIDPDGLTLGSLWRGILGDGDIQVPVPIRPPHELGASDLPGTIEESELVLGQLDVDVDPPPQGGEGEVVSGDLGGPHIVSDRREGEVGPRLWTLLPAGPGPSGQERLGDDLDGCRNMIRLESILLPNLVVDEMVQGDGGEHLGIPGGLHDVVHGTHEDHGEFVELDIVIPPDLDGDRAFHIIRDYVLLEEYLQTIHQKGRFRSPTAEAVGLNGIT